MKILQLNMWGGTLMREVVKLLAAEQPDVVCLQEVYSSPYGRTKTFDNLQNVQAVLPGYATAFAPLYDFMCMGKRVYYGNALLTRHEIVRQERVMTGLAYQMDFDHDAHDYNIRGMLSTTLSANGQPLHVLVHHGHHDRSTKDGTPETTRQIAEVATHIDMLDGPLVLCGDLNLLPGSASLAPLHARLENLCVRYGVENTRNRLSRHLPHVCDYIFARDVRVASMTVHGEVVSDHAALVARIDLTKKAP